MKLLWRALAVGLFILGAAGQVQGGSARDAAIRRRVLIGFRRAAGPDTRAQVVTGAGGEVNHSYHLLPVVSAILTDDVIDGLRRRPEVVYVEGDPRVYAAGQSLPWGVDRIDAEQVWQAGPGKGGAGIDVAIIDTGIDNDHPDLRVLGGINFTGQLVLDGSRRPVDWDDKEGHGTHCAGVVAALNNTIGVVGVAPEVNLWAVKVLDDNRSGYVSDVIKGLEWCVDYRIEIASMSFAGAHSASFEEACDTAYRAGVLLVAASGNSGASTVGYPAAYDSVIAVSAIDSSGALAPFSNTGPEIELTAPGAEINSTYCDGGYATLSGTSMACPHVAGAAALVWACPELGLGGADDVRLRLCETAEVLSYLGVREGGFGLVDAQRAAMPVPITDLAITKVGVDASVAQGDAVDVAVTIKNEGNQEVAGLVRVTLTSDPADSEEGDDRFLVGRQMLSSGLGVGASTTLMYTWETQSFPPDTYTLIAAHNLRDDESANNSCSVSVEVCSALMDIAVTGIEAPEDLSAGQSAEIIVTIENTGDYDVSSDISVELTSDNTTVSDGRDDLAVGQQLVNGGLAVGEFVTLSFAWDTGGANAGVHVLTASHDWADDRAANDTRTATVNVNVSVTEVTPSEVIVSHVSPRSLWAGRPGTLMIRGDGFMEGLTVTFEGGAGPAPTVTSVRVLGAGSLVSRVTAPNGPLATPQVWDVRITNPDGSSGVLKEALTVQ